MFIGKKIKIKNHGASKGGIIESIVISLNNDDDPVIHFELQGGRKAHGTRFLLRNCEIVQDRAESKVEESRARVTNSKLFSILTERIKSGDAELIIRRQNISAYKVRAGTATHMYTAIFDESKQVVVGVR